MRVQKTVTSFLALPSSSSGRKHCSDDHFCIVFHHWYATSASHNTRTSQTESAELGKLLQTAVISTVIKTSKESGEGACKWSFKNWSWRSK